MSTSSLPQSDLLSKSFEALKMNPPAFLPSTDSNKRDKINSTQSQFSTNTQPFTRTLYAQEVPIYDNEKDESEAELYVPGLTSPSLFTLLPMSDTLTPLLERYINGSTSAPRRDLTGEHRGDSLDNLIAERKWRSVAKYCQDTIINSDQGRTSFLLAHWALRLYALTQIELISHISSEISQLFSLLPPSSYNSPSTSNSTEPLFHPIVPFSLHVLQASLPGMKGAKEISIEELSDIARSCKIEMWKFKKENNLELEELWKERVVRVGCMISGLLIEIKATSSAASILSSHSSLSNSPDLLSLLCKLYISTGDLTSYSKTIKILEENNVESKRLILKTRALGKVANGEYNEAESIYRELLVEDPTGGEVVNNLAVSLLFQSKLKESISTLTNLLQTNPKMGYSSETILFNISTLTELRTDKALQVKIDLLRNVIENGGEGLKGGCLKLSLA